MIRRYLQDSILDSLTHFPSPSLPEPGKWKIDSGPGLINSSWNAAYLTLDDRAVLDAALRDPDGLISGVPIPVVIDEVQRAPDLMRAIKKSVDRQQKPGQYLLTGSANIMTLSTVSESMAGRVVLHTLPPFGWPEFLGKPLPTLLKGLFETASARQLLQHLPNHPKRIIGPKS